jgi:hypothetical protein
MPTNDLLTRATRALHLAGPDAVLASHTAAHLHGCLAADSAAVHILMRQKRRLRRNGVVFHHSTWEPRHVEVLHGLKVLALEHALADMLCRAHSPTAFECLTQALATHPEGFRDLVVQSVRARADPRGRKKAEILLKLATTGLPPPEQSRG